MVRRALFYSNVAKQVPIRSAHATLSTGLPNPPVGALNQLKLTHMTYYGPKELAASLRTVRFNTIQVAEDIPAERYSYRATPESRSVAETLLHLAGIARTQYHFHFVQHANSMAGFNLLEFVDRLRAEESEPLSKTEILDILRREGDQFVQSVEAVDDAFLGEHVQFQPGMTPPSRTRFEMLQSTKEHEMHHRAQLMLVERLLGVTPHLTRQGQERLAAMRAAQTAR